ncbi:MAG: tetratricopeptide repeat protein [Caldilineaceae bacterium]
MRIYLCGPLRMEAEQGPIHLPRRKVETLLAYLLLHPEPQSRDHLATLFWGDTADEKARHSLRTALATLRRQVGDDLLLTDRDHVQLNPAFPLWVDLREMLALEQEVENANADLLQAKLALWQGDLLTGCYDEWLTVEREHYRGRLLQLFLRAIQALRTRSDYAHAIALAHQLLTLDPANEQAHQHLMFCFMANGDRAAALHQYDLCVQALRTDLDVSPMPATTALYHWIKQQDGQNTTAARITNLPLPLTSFVGRTQEMTALKQLLNPTTGTTRLLTLTGAGGSGKTRLAIQVATDLIDSFADGVWWTELASLSDGALVPAAVAKTLGVTVRADEPILQSVCHFLGEKTLLLVIDNCEHLVDACAQLVDDLLRHCPNLQILATSREALSVPVEAIWQAPTLAVPEATAVVLTDVLGQFACIRLFCERAAAVQPDFRLTLDNARAVVDICAQLDGIPLAIELAAARVKVLSVEQIAAYLQSAIGARFALLTQGSRTVLPRQQTLRAAIDWSYALLDEAERQLFRAVAIFRGGFTLEALARIVSSGAGSPTTPNPPPATRHLLDLLTHLVDKSLVIVEPHAPENRYRLLETLREYALEQSATTDERQQWQRRHATYFLHIAEEAGAQLLRTQPRALLDRLEVEHANLRTALDYLLQDTDGTAALRLATALQPFWDYRGYSREGREWMKKALAKRECAPSHILAKAFKAAGWLAYRQGDFAQARLYLDEGLLQFEQIEEEAGIVDTMQLLAVLDMDQGNYPAAQQRLEKGLRLAQASDYQLGIALAQSRLGSIDWDQDRFADARDHYREYLRVARLLGHEVHIAVALINVGDTERMLDNLVAAQTNYEESLQIVHSLAHKGLIGAVLKSMGLLAFKQADYNQARQYGEEALRIFRDVGDKLHMGFALDSLGGVAKKLGEYSQSLIYCVEYLQIMVEVGYQWPIFEALENISDLLVKAGQQFETAARFWGAADHLRQETGIAIPPNQQEKRDRVLTHLQQQLGAPRLAILLDEGRHTSVAACVDQALTLTL